MTIFNIVSGVLSRAVVMIMLLMLLGLLMMTTTLGMMIDDKEYAAPRKIDSSIPPLILHGKDLTSHPKSVILQQPQFSQYPGLTTVLNNQYPAWQKGFLAHVTVPSTDFSVIPRKKGCEIRPPL